VPKYELIFVLRADQPEAEVQSRVEKASAMVTDAGGQILLHEHWGPRRLAYEIDHQTQGDYTFIRYDCPGTVNADIDRLFRQDDLCLRHLIVVDEEWPERNRLAQAKARRGAAAAASPEAAAQ
jgi:small subunit ribosomal protein S6